MNDDMSDDARQTIRIDDTMLRLCPAPALVLGADGGVIWANAAANDLAGGISRNLFSDISTLIDKTLTHRIAVVEPLTLPVPDGSISLEVTLLPTQDETVLVLPRNVSMDRNLRDALIDSRQRYRDIVEISSDFAWETDADGRFIFVSPGGALDYGADDLIGRMPHDFLLDGSGGNEARVFSATHPLHKIALWFKRKSGTPVCLSVSGKPVTGRQGKWCGARGLCQDITEERNRQTELAHARNRDRLMTYIVRTIRDELDPGKMMERAAEASARALGMTGCQIFRLSEDGLLRVQAAQGEGLDPLVWNNAATSLLSGHTQAETDSVNCRLIALATRYHNALNGAVAFWRLRDEAAFDAAEKSLMHELADQLGIAIAQAAHHDRILTLSRTDGMTGLLNRRAFFEELGRRFTRLGDEDKPAALMYVDMDNFKLVNDIHGHQRGDDAILALRDILRRNTRVTDLVARLGGDEFVVWLEGVDVNKAHARAGHLLHESGCLKQYSGSAERPLGLSIGIAVRTAGSDESLENLILRADGAMYDVKNGGKGSFRIAPAFEQDIAQ